MTARLHGGPRPFVLVRDEDVSGVSGTGIVAEGAVFSDGTVALRWLSQWPTSVVFHDRGLESVERVHGHDGRTRVVFLDTEPDAGDPVPSLEGVVFTDVVRKAYEALSLYVPEAERPYPGRACLWAWGMSPGTRDHLHRLAVEAYDGPQPLDVARPVRDVPPPTGPSFMLGLEVNARHHMRDGVVVLEGPRDVIEVYP